MPSSMHNVIVLAHVIILSFMCACCKANLIIMIIIARLTIRCSYNELFTRVKRWLTNRIHGNAAEHS